MLCNNIGTNDKFCRKVAGIQLQNKKLTEDLALGCHPRDNGHVTHWT